jgi:uncharacterized repeat protein (TIGR01451 family)
LVGTPALAAPGTPGVPQAPITIFAEDFQNRPAPTPIVRLTGYTGVTGQTYTADPPWLTNCNGWIAAANQPLNSPVQVAECPFNNTSRFWNAVQQQALALGQFAGQTPAAAQNNYAVSALTSGNPGAPFVQLQTASNIPFPTPNRFVTASLDIAAINCVSFLPPLAQFSLLTDTGTAIPVGGQINGCSSPTSIVVPALGAAPSTSVVVGTYTGNGALLVTGGSVGVRVVNNQPSGNGNDSAVDNLKILDVTPQLDKAFSPTSLLQGANSTLTFTITNTTELGAKNGWSFSDSLPAGLTVGSGAVPATTCPSGSVTASPGATTITASGNLTTGMTSCTVSVSVTSAAAAAYTNGPANLTTIGLIPPGSASVTFTPVVDLHVTKQVSSDPYVPGTPLTYMVRVANTGPSNAVGVAVSDPLPPALSGFAWTCLASAGSSCTPNGTGNIADLVNIVANGQVVYTITGTVPPATTATLVNTATVTPPGGTTDAGCSPTCSATTTTPANPTTGLAIHKTSTPDPYVPGATLTYTVTVTNSGPSDAVGASVSDPIPPLLAGAGFTWTCTPTPGSSCTASGTASIVDTVTVLAGGQLVYTISGTVPAGASGQVVNTATVSPPANTTDPGCLPSCSASDASPPGPSVSMAVSKGAVPSPYVPGAALAFTVTVTNAGPSNAVGANVSDPLPAALAGAGFTWTCTPSVGSTCTATGVGDVVETVDVAAGGQLVYTITGTVPSNTRGSLTNTATVTPPAASNDAACSPSCSSTTITDANPVSNLAVSKDAIPSPFVPGTPLTYVVKVVNTGPSDALGARVSDTLPPEIASAGFTWSCTATPGSSCLTSGARDFDNTVDVAAGGQLVYTITGTVPPSVQTSLTNTATVIPPPGTTAPNCTPSCSAATVTAPNVTVGLSVTKTATPDPYVPGSALTYTVIVTNAGPSDALGASVSDPLPPALVGAGFTWTCTPSTGSACSPTGSGSITDTVDVLAGARVTYTITGTVPAATTAHLTNTATVTPPPSTTAPGCTLDCSATSDTAANPTVALTITKTATPSPYVPGTPLTYTVTVSNAGPSDAIGVTVTDPLPAALVGAGFTWTCSASSGSTCSPAGTGTINESVNILAAGQLVYTITGTVPPSAQAGLANTATATPPPGTTDAGCTPDCSSAIDTAANPTVALTITKTATPSPYVPGTNLTYTVTVSNAGPSDAIGATVTDPLPATLAGAGFSWNCTPSAGSSCTPTGSGDIDDTVTILSAGQLVYTITGTVPSSAVGDLTNTASVAPPAGATDAACIPDCSTSIETAANPTVALTITKTATPSPYVPGANLTYTVTVSNAGPSDAVGATVTDPLPATLTGVAWSCAPSAGSSCTPTGSGDIDDTVTILSAGQLVYTITGAVPSSAVGDLTNTATVAPPPGTSDAGCAPDCGATIETAANPTVALTVTKTATPSPYVPGTPLTYTVTVSNAGPSDAIGATVTDPLPAALVGFTWTCAPSSGSTCAPAGTGNITDTVTLRAGGQLVYTITGTVPSSAVSGLSNTATVTPAAGTTDTACTRNCSATIATAANPVVALTISKTATPSPYVPGVRLTYTVTVSNAGPSDAVGATVTDPLPAALAGFTWTCTATSGSSCTATGTGNIADTVTVAAAGRLVYTITGTVPAGTTGQLVNNASLAAAAGSTNTGCSTCTASISVASAPPVTLPPTGLQLSGAIGRAFALIIAGAVLIAAASRRRPTPRRTTPMG